MASTSNASTVVKLWSGSVMDVIAEQPSNAHVPTLVKVAGKVTEENQVASWKAHVSILVAVAGSVSVSLRPNSLSP